MSRLVRTKPAPAKGVDAAPAEGALKEYLARVAKYVPSEIVAAYIFSSGIIMSWEKNVLQLILYLIVFFALLILTPFYLCRMAEPGDKKLFQIIIAMIAFVIWAYSLGGLPALLGIYIPQLASIVLVLFSMIAGLYQPKE